MTKEAVPVLKDRSNAARMSSPVDIALAYAAIGWWKRHVTMETESRNIAKDTKMEHAPYSSITSILREYESITLMATEIRITSSHE